MDKMDKKVNINQESPLNTVSQNLSENLPKFPKKHPLGKFQNKYILPTCKL